MTLPLCVILQVSKASDAAGIQLMQMNRLKAIQEEAIYMQEQQHKELESLKAELQVLNICIVRAKNAFQESVSCLNGMCVCTDVLAWTCVPTPRSCWSLSVISIAAQGRSNGRTRRDCALA